MPPLKPVFQDFQFKTIGKEPGPALLMRLSSSSSEPTDIDVQDIDDIYEQSPLPAHPGTSTRPSLLQTLAADENQVSDSNAHDVLKHYQNPLLAMPPSCDPHLSTSSNITPSQNVPSSSTERSVPEIQTHLTSISRRRAPTNNLIISPSDHDQLTDPKPLDDSKSLKKVVALKDKFLTVSTTARQSQRLAKQALMSAQRSAAAAQSCLAAAQSFVPCVSDVISTIRRMQLASEAFGLSSEWIAVVRDLEDGLHDLRQWSSIAKKDPFTDHGFGQPPSHLRTSHLDLSPPLPGAPMVRASSSGFLLTSVEEEAQEALRAWNQLDWHIHETDCSVNNGDHRREPRFQTGRPKLLVHLAQRPETEPQQASQHPEVRKSVSEKLTEAPTDSNSEQQGEVQAEIVTQQRGDVEELMAVEAAVGAAGVLQGDSQDNHMQEYEQQYSPQTCMQERLSVGAAADTKIGNVTPGKHSHHQQGSSSSPSKTIIRHTQAALKSQENVSAAPSSPSDRDAHASPPVMAASIAENYTEQTPISVSKSRDTQADQQPTRLPSAVSDEVSVFPRNGIVATENDSGSRTRPSTSMPTIYANSEAAANNSGEKAVVLQLKIILPEARSSESKQLRDIDYISPVKTETVEPQLNIKVDEPEYVQVKPEVNVPLKPKPETPEKDENEAGPSSDLPAPLPDLQSVVQQKRVEADTPRTSHSLASAQPTHIPASSDSPVSPPQLSATTQNSPPPVSSPVSAIPLALRVERPIHPNQMHDPDESISPDLMSSGGWDADDNEGSRRAKNASPSRFEPTPRSRSRGVESRSQHANRSAALHQSYPNVGSPLAKGRTLPNDGPPKPSNDPPAPLIGKKRPRVEDGHPGPLRNKRGWTGAGVPSVSTTPSGNDVTANPHSNRLEPSTPVVGPKYNLNSGLQHPGPSLMRRLDPSSQSSFQPANNALGRRLQQPLRPRQGPHTKWHRSGYDSYRPSYQNFHGYEDNRAPELLDRISLGHPQPNHVQTINPSIPSLRRVAPTQPQNFKPLSLFDRLH